MLKTWVFIRIFCEIRIKPMVFHTFSAKSRKALGFYTKTYITNHKPYTLNPKPYNTTSWQAYASASCSIFETRSQKDRPSSLTPGYISPLHFDERRRPTTGALNHGRGRALPRKRSTQVSMGHWASTFQPTAKSARKTVSN